MLGSRNKQVETIDKGRNRNGQRVKLARIAQMHLIRHVLAVSYGVEAKELTQEQKGFQSFPCPSFLLFGPGRGISRQSGLSALFLVRVFRYR